MRLRKGDIPKLIAAVLLIVASVGYLVVTLRQRGRMTPARPAQTASTMSTAGGAAPPQLSGTVQTAQGQTEPSESTAIGPPSSELRPGTKLVVKVVDPFGLPPSAMKKGAEAKKPEQVRASATKAPSLPSMPLPPALVAETVKPYIATAESARDQARPAPNAGASEGQPAPPSVACTIEGDEMVAILRTSTGRSVVVRTGDKVEGYRVTSIRTGEVVFRAGDGGTRVMTVGAKPNGS